MPPLPEQGEGQQLGCRRWLEANNQRGRELMSARSLAVHVVESFRLANAFGRSSHAPNVLHDPDDFPDHRHRASHDSQSHSGADGLAQRVEADDTPGLAVGFHLQCQVAAGRALVEVQVVVGVIFEDYEIKPLGQAQTARC